MQTYSTVMMYSKKEHSLFLKLSFSLFFSSFGVALDTEPKTIKYMLNMPLSSKLKYDIWK